MGTAQTRNLMAMMRMQISAQISPSLLLPPPLSKQAASLTLMDSCFHYFKMDREESVHRWVWGERSVQQGNLYL